MADHDIMARNTLIADVIKALHTLSPCGLPPSQEDNVRAMLEAYLPGPRQADLFDELPREGNRLVRAATAMACGEAKDHDPSLALAIKLAITIGHMRAGRLERALETEVSAIAGVLGLQVPRDGTLGGPAPDVPVDVPVEFMFQWRPGSARRPATLGTSIAHVDLVEVDPVDAPVACSLWTQEGRLEMRRRDGAWLRPVLSPGTWRPVTVPEFREAGRTGCAWPNSPFRPDPRRGSPTFHLLDLAGSQPLTAANARRISDARDACLVGAGQLHVVDGVVHRVTGPPTAGVGMTFWRGRWSTGPAWRVDGLASTRGMGTFSDAPVATWFNGVPTPDRSGGDDPDGGFVALSDWIGTSRLMEARAERFGGGPAPDTPSIGDLAWAPERLLGVPDVHGCLRVAAGMAMRLLPLAHLLEPSGYHARACVRLKEALAASKASLDAGRGVEARSLEAIGALCAEVLSVDRPVADPLGGMWAYVAALASHAADVGTSLHDEDEELVDLEI